VVIVGAGWISARPLRPQTPSVIMIEPLSQPLFQVLGERLVAHARIHRGHGVVCDSAPGDRSAVTGGIAVQLAGGVGRCRPLSSASASGP
jgi:hypothetical protein